MKKKLSSAIILDPIKESMEMGAYLFQYHTKKDPAAVKAAALLVRENDNSAAAKILMRAFKIRKEHAETFILFLHCANIINKSVPFDFFQEVHDAGQTIH